MAKRIGDRELANIRNEVDRELNDLGEDLTALAIDYLDKKQVSVTGDLRKSITHEVSRELNGFSLSWGTNLKYAVYVHEGTKPHLPPEQPIRQWVVKKLGIIGDAVPNVTAKVRWTIARKGTKGKPFLKVPFRAFKNQILDRIINAIDRGINAS